MVFTNEETLHVLIDVLMFPYASNISSTIYLVLKTGQQKNK